jgi:hypothetical protein
MEIMPMRLTKIALASVTALVAVAATASAYAESTKYPNPRPMFARFTDGTKPGKDPASAPPTWTFSFTYNSKTYNDVFIGTDPKKGSATTTVPVYIIPVALTYGSTTYTPDQVLANGETVTQNIVSSPLLNGAIDFNVQSTDLGTTQYEDAFARASYWQYVKKKASGYHVLLGNPTIEATTNITVPNGDGSIDNNPFGAGQVMEVSFSWFDTQAYNLVKSFAVPASALPMIVVTQVYWVSGGCCIGGWHNFRGGQAYSIASYQQDTGVFSQDVSAWSHELGEWLDDYTINNQEPCGGIYEVGDPLEGEANYGAYAYKGTNGFSYNLQDLVTPPYFGAKSKLSLGKKLSLVGKFTLGVCSRGQ